VYEISYETELNIFSLNPQDSVAFFPVYGRCE